MYLYIVWIGPLMLSVPVINMLKRHSPMPALNISQSIINNSINMGLIDVPNILKSPLFTFNCNHSVRYTWRGLLWMNMNKKIYTIATTVIPLGELN